MKSTKVQTLDSAQTPVPVFRCHETKRPTVCMALNGFRDVFLERSGFRENFTKCFDFRLALST